MDIMDKITKRHGDMGHGITLKDCYQIVYFDGDNGHWTLERIIYVTNPTQDIPSSALIECKEEHARCGSLFWQHA